MEKDIKNEISNSITKEQKKFVGQKLTQYLDSLVEEEDLSVSKEHKGNNDRGIKLLASSTHNVEAEDLTTDDSKPKKQKRVKIKRRKLSESSTDEDTRIREAAVTFDVT